MNKKDLNIIAILITISVISIYLIQKKTDATYAYVYHDEDIILKIDLSIDNIYNVNGDNGNVEIEVKDKKIRVVEENSPNHICSKQGFISTSYEQIVCLPNDIIITIKDDKIDGVLK